jgi:hypothetical protein
MSELVSRLSDSIANRYTIQREVSRRNGFARRAYLENDSEFDSVRRNLRVEVAKQKL